MKKSEEKLILDFCVKNCEINQIYQCQVESCDKSLGFSETFETEEIKCNANNKNVIFFQKKLIVNFNFAKIQKLKILFHKKVIIDRNMNYKDVQIWREKELSALISPPNSIYERPLFEKIPGKDIFSIRANRYENENTKINYISDFLKSGVKFNIFIASDFSDGINKQPREKSIKNYVKIIANLSVKTYNYAKNRSIYLYGYGCELKKKKNDDDDIFNFNSEGNVPISIVDINKVYLPKTKEIIPKKKVNLSKLIRKVTKKISDLYEERNYNILFILARELPDVSDKQESIDAYIESTYLPLTIFIIGEGKNEFHKLKDLFGDKIKAASTGMPKNRNNTIYTKFLNEFNEKEERLTQWCFEQISDQVIQFYDLIKCSPQQIWENNMEAIKQSFMKYNEISICISESKLFPNNFTSRIINENINKINIVNPEMKKEEINEKDNINKININKEKQNINEINIWNNNKMSEKTNDNNEKNIINTNNKGDVNKYNTPYHIECSVNKDLISDTLINNIFKNENNSEENIVTTANPDNDKVYRIPTSDSVWPIKENPYCDNSRSTPGNDENKIQIPQESVCPVIKDNPYITQKNINEKIIKKESKIDSYNISTEESYKSSNNLDTKKSKFYKYNNNYSIDN